MPSYLAAYESPVLFGLSSCNVGRREGRTQEWRRMKKRDACGECAKEEDSQ